MQLSSPGQAGLSLPLAISLGELNSNLAIDTKVAPVSMATLCLYSQQTQPIVLRCLYRGAQKFTSSPYIFFLLQANKQMTESYKIKEKEMHLKYIMVGTMSKPMSWHLGFC